MTHLMIVAHTPLASALKAVAEHTYPEAREAITAIDVDPNATAEALSELVRQRLSDEPTLILCDTVGATPSNAACQCFDAALTRPPDTLAVVSGVNVPMLWRALCYRHEPPVDLAKRALEGGMRGVQWGRGTTSDLS